MTCEVCGTELPVGAMFCGECGTAIALTPPRRDPEGEAGVAPDAVAGPVLPPASPVFGVGDTISIEAADLDALAGVSDDLDLEGMAVDEPGSEPEQGADNEQEPEPVAVPALVEPGASAWSPEWQSPEVPAAEAPSESVSEGDADAQDDVEQDLPPDLDDDVPAESSTWAASAAKVFTDADDLEQTLIVPRREQGERFVLQFSTGESITVFGSGLLGRNPTPQPGEFFDQLVPISDPGKSVSKTHLEFGQESGSFWVSDRFSGNGSIIREPESTPRRLSAGKRYRIVRGTRVDIAEQFFIVS